MHVHGSRFCIVAVLAVALAACTERQLGFPRVQLSSRSPDGLHEAVVRNHPDIDPPNQSLWLRDAHGPATRLRALSPDQDWCNTVVWSGDSSKVGFLVQDARLLVYDVASRKLIAGAWLVPEDSYPTTHDAREVSLGKTGERVTFRSCWRESSNCSAPTARSLVD